MRHFYVVLWRVVCGREAAKALGLEYCSLDEVLTQSDIISLHLPLLPETYHIIGLAMCLNIPHLLSRVHSLSL